MALYFKTLSEKNSLKLELAKNLEESIELKEELGSCKKALNIQNEEIKKLKVEVKYTKPKSVEKLEKLSVENKSCEAKLKAYSELFKLGE